MEKYTGQRHPAIFLQNQPKIFKSQIEMQANNLDLFPQLYHVHHQNKMEDLLFWQRLVRQNPQRVLELGCGTGRLTLPLAQSARRILGLDKDLAMLRFLKSQMRCEALETIELVQADFSAFNFAFEFSLIFLACNTYSTLTREDRRCLLANVCRILSKHGVFSASMPNPSFLKQLPARGSEEIEEILTHPLTGNPLQISSEWLRKGSIFTLTWHYDHLFPTGIVERTTCQIQHRLQSSEDYLGEIRQSGLSVKELFGDYNGQPYHQDSTYLIFVVVPA